MNADLEEMLRADDGAELREIAARLRAAPQAHVSPAFTAEVMARRRDGGCRVRRRIGRSAWTWAAAAGVAALLGVGALFHRSNVPEGVSVAGASPEGNASCAVSSLVACQRADGTFSSSSASPYVQAFAVTALAKERTADADALQAAVDALLRGQQADGGWSNARLSACNVCALQTAVNAGVAAARPAYRRGLRYLHAQGIGELSLQDLVQEAKTVSARLAGVADPGLLRCASLCASL